MFKSNNRSLNSSLLFSFGAFGLTALVFQVVFAKKLVLLFGLTAPAIATVIAVYFSGLALGSLVFGKLADRYSPKKVFNVYIGLFLLTGLYGFLFPSFFKLLNFLILAVNKVYPLHFAGFNFFAFLFAFLFLILPAILIGAGFPIVNKMLVQKEGEVGKKVSVVYFIETFGSVIGVALAGFWLIPTFGNNLTIFLAAGLNVVVAGVLFLFMRNANYLALSWQQPPEVLVKEDNSKNIQHPVFLFVLFVTGFLALALEVFYTKTLILSIGSSTYAFSVILVTFLLGIALGSYVASLFIGRIARGYAYFGMFLGLVGFWLFLTVKLFERVPFWYLNIFKSYESFDFSAVLSAQFLTAFLVIFPATFLMGIIFPLGIRLAGIELKKLGAGVGKLYFANTLGGVFGSLVSGFLLLPFIGYQKTILLILLVYFLIGGFFIVRDQALDRTIKGLLIFFLVFWGIFSIFSSPWSKGILSLGVFPYARDYINIGEEIFLQGLKTDKVIFYKEGLSNITVIKRGGETLLRINGKTDASNSISDLEAEVLIGALPMLFHKNPKDVLVIGLGSGITLGTVAQFSDAKNIDLLEIDPNIVQAANYFKNDNHDVLNDSRVKTILADGRNYLSLTSRKYDVISSEPSNFWVEGNALLFTKEFYELSKVHLNEGGIMLQWIQGYSLEEKDIQSIIKTFQEVFPQIYLFSSMSSGDLFLVGSISDELIINLSNLEEKFNDPGVRDELERIYITDPYEILTYLNFDNNQLKEYSSDAKIHTDNNPFLEFSAPKSLYKNTAIRLIESISSFKSKSDLSYSVLGEDRQKVNQYLKFSKDIIPVKTALGNNNLLELIDSYKEIRKSGRSQLLIEFHIIQKCNQVAVLAQLSDRESIASEVLEKCATAFNEVILDKN